MADVNKLMPHIIQWESGQKQKARETTEDYFNRSKNTAYANDKDDTGGPTMMGVTIGTFTAYKRKKGLRAPSVQELKDLDYDTWVDILKPLYWDKWKADQIANQSVADLLVDWYWGSGDNAIVFPQKILRVTADGVVGPKTLAAVNDYTPQSELFDLIFKRREQFYYNIVKSRPSQKKWLNGWLNRLYEIKFQK